jgi:hypothetical protein
MERGVSTMIEYHVLMTDELGHEFSVTVSVPALVENVTEWVREEFPESSIVYIAPKGF